ncbi:hypothetical protein AJ80_04829 [Polytolypa hystricis UAMH7299]|uniref:Palmitoyltransferase n=1 Tax=Polytolypa hystricis (strain UAMH7299) TaxID=1447883 RepID=A0A2B7Y001_POLH7|nr:hypothetical protein AJ80_04829 [Polytolypa hystricis UAMH7299]
MEWLQEIALIVLSISFFTFVALFGRIPALRKTPIGLIYRIIWIHIPNFLGFLDTRLFGGLFVRGWNRTGRYLLHENHALVLIFFIILLVISEVLFIPSAWPRIDLKHRVCTVILVVLPYLFLYASVTTTSAITPQNHHEQMRRYPYDHVLFHPGFVCKTCHLLKPARSKHCSLCNMCVSRHDHHCIWLKNCVGQNNYHYFMGLLLSTAVLLTYGAYLGYVLLDKTLQDAIVRNLPGVAYFGRHWSTGTTWSIYMHLWGLAIADDLRIGGVFLLALLTTPLAAAMFLYHVYLLWAGTTTNESAKWSDWQDDVADGLVFKAMGSQVSPRRAAVDKDVVEPTVPWPITNDQVLLLSEGPPRVGYRVCMESRSIVQPEDNEAPIDQRWTSVGSMKEVVNIYDAGFWSNLQDAMRIRRR